MSSQWQNFLCNLGEWHGSFSTLGPDGQPLTSTPSILTLEQGAEERLVHFRLRRFQDQSRSTEPIHDLRQEYRSLGRQVVFFANGTFCKGSLQVAPGTAFGAEFGFIDGDRRHRLVLLHEPEGAFEKLVLIREFRAGSDAAERPPLSPEQLLGHWHGHEDTIHADWPEPEPRDCSLNLDPEAIAAGRLLPDGGYCLGPAAVSHRQAFSIEALWLPAADRMQRLIRRYDASGAWISASHQVLTRA
ncbi:MAG: DUF3598 family protein [Cyanobium sp.]